MAWKSITRLHSDNHGRDNQVRPSLQETIRSDTQAGVWVVAGFVVALSVLLVGIVLLSEPGRTHPWIIYLAWSALALVLMVVYLLWRNVLLPQKHLQDWLLMLHAGDLSQRLDETGQGIFQKINKDLNTWAHMLESQSRHSEKQLREHTEHILRKNRSLSGLYRIASSINAVQQFETVLKHAIEVLMELFALEGAVIRLSTKDGRLQKVAAAGSVPAAEQQAYFDADSPFLRNDKNQHRCVVAIKHHGDTLGYCSLYLSGQTLVEHDEELASLLHSVADCLGVAIAKERLNQQNKNLSIIKERTWIAYELHDSLAQTINSLRFKTRVLDQALHEGNEASIWSEMEKLENAIELANKEVRGLIRHFRDYSPIDSDKNDFNPVERCIEDFRYRHPEINLFFQKEWHEKDLPRHYTHEISRIVREALNNAHKHGDADYMRVVLRDEGNGNYFVLIEDNGCGIDNFSEAVVKPDHFGLGMMKECAGRIGGDLQIDTEKDEGVRVNLKFTYTASQAEQPADEGRSQDT